MTGQKTLDSRSGPGMTIKAPRHTTPSPPRRRGSSDFDQTVRLYRQGATAKDTRFPIGAGNEEKKHPTTLHRHPREGGGPATLIKRYACIDKVPLPKTLDSRSGPGMTGQKTLDSRSESGMTIKAPNHTTPSPPRRRGPSDFACGQCTNTGGAGIARAYGTSLSIKCHCQRH